MLSMLAALQAPIIMMSQNRQAAKDRLEARLDYETNMRSETEIACLHKKVDALQEQLELLVELGLKQHRTERRQDRVGFGTVAASADA
jgi:uncharacterized membrane protein